MTLLPIACAAQFPDFINKVMTKAWNRAVAEPHTRPRSAVGEVTVVAEWDGTNCELFVTNNGSGSLSTWVG